MIGLKKIISGAQTGADRAGIDAAMARPSYHWGGCVPKGRLAEDGEISKRYFAAKCSCCGLFEHESSRNYNPRTVRNIIDSDATIIFRFRGEGRVLGPGTKLTISTLRKKEKIYRIFDPSKINGVNRAVRWICETKIPDGESFKPIETLNIAGSRESSSPGIYKKTRIFMDAVLCYVYAYQRWGTKIWELTDRQTKINF